MGKPANSHTNAYSTLTNTSVVRPHPPITRALKHAKSKLQAAGIKVIDWEPYKHKHGWDIIVRHTPTPSNIPPPN